MHPLLRRILRQCPCLPPPLSAAALVCRCPRPDMRLVIRMAIALCGQRHFRYRNMPGHSSGPDLYRAARGQSHASGWAVFAVMARTLKRAFPSGSPVTWCSGP